MKLGEAILYLISDNKGLESGLKDAESKAAASTGRLGGIMQGISQGIGQAAFSVVMTAAATAKSAVEGSIGLASDLGESTNKVKVVFGEQADAILKWSETTAGALGQSQLQALNAVGTFGNLFVSMGMAGDESKNMSLGLVELASDLASFNNIDPSVALEKLRAGLVGETEPLRTLGVNLSAAAVEAKALSMGLAQADVDMTKVNGATLDLEQAQLKAAEALKKHGEDSIQYRQAVQTVAEAEDKLTKALEGSKVELTAAQKAQATYALIMEQTKTAQGDFANTSEGLANQQRIQAAEWENLKTKLGTGLLPIQMEFNKIMGSLISNVLPPLVELLVNQVIPAIQSLIDWFKSLSPETQTTILAVTGIVAAFLALMPVITSVISAVSGAATVIGLLSNPIGWVILAVGALAVAWTQNWGGIQEKVAVVWQSLKDFWAWLTGIASGAIALAISAPEWIVTLTSWLWPALFGPPGWILTLVAWLWPEFVEQPEWLKTLLKWLWPDPPEQPAWVKQLVAWIWPLFPSKPQWLTDLLAWVWPSLPSLPSWLGGGGDETVAGSSVSDYSALRGLGGGSRLTPALATTGGRGNVYITVNVAKLTGQADELRLARRIGDAVDRTVRHG